MCTVGSAQLRDQLLPKHASPEPSFLDPISWSFATLSQPCLQRGDTMQSLFTLTSDLIFTLKLRYSFLLAFANVLSEERDLCVCEQLP